jgi:hypothetical protein
VKVSEQEVSEAIAAEMYHHFAGTTTTVCCLVLDNGMTAVGSSGCVDPSEFNAQMGRDIARRDAFGKAWAFMGFRLAEKMHTMKEG